MTDADDDATARTANPEQGLDLAGRIRVLEHQCSAILFLSAANMLTNVITIGIAVLAVWS